MYAAMKQLYDETAQLFQEERERLESIIKGIQGTLLSVMYSEAVRRYEFERMKRRFEEVERTHERLHEAVITLGGLHDDIDYLYLDETLLMSPNALSWDADGSPVFNHARIEGQMLVVDGDIIGL